MEDPKKNIGFYSKISAGEIITIDVQPLVSICQITNRATDKPFPIGSSLEYIPIGTTPRLLDYPRNLPSLSICGTTKELKNYLDEKLNEDNLLAVARIDFRQIKKDTSTKNTYEYYSIFSEIPLHFPPTTKLFLTNPYSLFITILKNDISDKPMHVLKKYFEKLSSKYTVTCGAVLPNTISNKYTKTAESILYFANCAYHQAFRVKDSLKLYFFDTLSASLVISKWRYRTSIPEEAIYDYHTLCSFGIKNQTINNQLGLVLLESFDNKYHQLMISCFREAVDEDPSVDTYVYNLALSYALAGDYKNSLEYFTPLSSKITSSSTKSYILAYAYSLLNIYKDNLNKECTNIINLALSIKNPDSLHSIYKKWFNSIYEFYQI